MSSRSGRACLALATGLLALALLLASPIQLVHTDVMNRAAVLRHWSQSSPSDVLHFAHLLEVPAARALQVASAFRIEPLECLRILEALAGAATVALLCWALAGQTGSLAIAIGGSATLFACHGFWRVCSGGEEKGLPLLFIFMVFVLALELLEQPDEAPSVRLQMALSGAVALSILTHLVGGVTLVGTLFLQAVPGGGNRRRERCLARSGLFGGLLAAAAYAFAGIVYLGKTSAAQIAEWVLHYHQKDSFFLHNLGRSFPDYLLKLASGIGSTVTMNPTLWELGSGWLLFLFVGLLAVISIRLIAIAAHKLPRPTALFGLMLLPWLANFLFYEPYNLESWLPMLPEVLFLAVVGMHAAYGKTALGSRRIAAMLAALPIGLMAVNEPVWAEMRKVPCVISGPGQLGPKMPSKALVLCGWDGLLAEYDYIYYVVGDGTEVLQYPHTPDSSAPPPSAWGVQRLAQAWRAGQPVLITSALKTQMGESLPGIAVPIPGLTAECMALLRLERKPGLEP